MEYKSLTIEDALAKIQSGTLYLPAIQRKFVWGHKQVELLFDSIMRDYPIGTFLLWFVEKDRFGDYAFYQFIKHYHERDNWKNQLADRTHLGDELIGVLDGQQRLNSMYVALQGTYAYKRPRVWRTSPGAYPLRRFYLNVFKPEREEEDDDFVYEFRFRTEKEADQVDADHCWYPVGELLQCQDISDITDEWDSFSAELPEALASDPDLSRMGRNMLARLWQRLTQTRLINYFPVHSQDLDDILDIFVRVNSAGKPLSRTDLLFSTIVAHWEEGRDKIELFLEGINERGNGFRFDTDFMMRAALVLAGCPTRLRVSSFKRENVERIVDSWESIEESIEAAVDLLVTWGFQGATLTSSNAVIPIAYAAKQGCDLEASGEDLRLFFVRSLLRGLYSGQSDQVLADLRRYLKRSLSEDSRFSIDDFEQNAKLPAEKTTVIDEEFLDEMLMAPKGARTFMLLSLLYPHLRFHQVQFHQDHIHPHAAFTTSNLRALGLEDEEISQWQEKRDCLPNLQLLEGQENQSKNAMPFKDWLKSRSPRSGDEGGLTDEERHYLHLNHIPEEISLELKDFHQFFEARKLRLRQALKETLRVVPGGERSIGL